MAKQDFSFDIVSEVSMPEVANAVDQTRREISQRFDFKDTGTSISQDDKLIEVRSSTEDRIKAAVKGLKIKVQSHIQGDQVRVSSKAKDDLQAVMRAVKEHDFDVPLQFTNFRP